MRIFCAAMLALSLGLYAAYDRTAKAADDPAAKLKEVKGRFNEEFDELLKRFEKVKSPAEQKGIQDEAKELATLTVEKVRKIAEAEPKSDTAFEAASFALGRLVTVGAKGPDVHKLFDIVIEHHLNNSKVRDMVLVAVRAGPTGLKFLETVSAKSTDKNVRAISLYILGMNASEASDDARTDKQAKELVEKAVGLLERAIKESPDTKVDGSTIKPLCEAEIKTVRLLAIGSPAPEIKGTELRDQKKQTLAADYKGKVVLVDFWFTRCGPCLSMIPHERDMVKKLAGKPFQLLSISVDEKKDMLTKFLEKEPMPWVHWWDGEENPLVESMRIKGFPTLYLIDAKGVIRRKWIGPPEPDDLDKAVDELLKEATAVKN